MSSRPSVTLIASDQDWYRRYLVGLLTSASGPAEVIERTSFDQALTALEDRSDIAMAIFDLPSPMTRHRSRLRGLRTRFPLVRVAIAASSDDRTDILAALQAGAHAYLPKSLGTVEMLQALHAVSQGEIFVPAVMSVLPNRSDAGRGPPFSAKYTELTSRQKDVLLLMQSGMRNKEIARVLNFTETTIKVHAQALYRKIGIRKRKDLIASLLAIKH
jgi:DNA-binding NarL/FixJ family response regulator